MILLKVKYNKNIVIIKCGKYLNVVIIDVVIIFVIFISLYYSSNKDSEIINLQNIYCN